MSYSSKRTLTSTAAVACLALLHPGPAGRVIASDADLQLLSTQFNPQSVAAGGKLEEVSWFLLNNGPDTLNRPTFRFDLFLSRNAKAGDADDVKIDSGTIPYPESNWPAGSVAHQRMFGIEVPPDAFGAYRLVSRVSPIGTDPVLANNSAVSVGVLTVTGRGFRIMNPTRSAEGFAVSVTTSANETYILEYKATLSDRLWTAVAAASGDGAVRELIHSDTAGAQGYYRIVAASQPESSFHAGEVYLTAQGENRLFRSGRAVAVRSHPGREVREVVQTLTSVDGGLAGFEPLFEMSGYAILELPPAADSLGLEALSQTLAAAVGSDGIENVEPVFEDPRTGRLFSITDAVIVCLKPGVSAPDYFGNDWPDVRPLSGTTNQFIHHRPGGTAQSVLDLSNAHTLNPSVEWAEPNFLCQVVLSGEAPSDPLFDLQWHLHNTGQTGGTPDADVDALEAWDISRGAGVTIAVLDDGFDLDHPDLAQNVFRNPGETLNGQDDDLNGLVDDVNGWDFGNGWLFFVFIEEPDDNDPRPGDEDNHGTATAGLAVARGNNGIGVIGVAPEARFLPIRLALYGGNGVFVTAHKYAAAIYYAAGRAVSGQRRWPGADIFNMSFGLANPNLGDEGMRAIDEALAWAAREGRNGKGCVLMASSGNSRVAPVGYPASHADVLAIGASTDRDERALYSNYGLKQELLAPGGSATDVTGQPGADLPTTDRQGPVGYNASDGVAGNYTLEFRGTSAASPVAAGVAALVLSVNPDLTAGEVRQILRGTADKVGSLAYVDGRNDEYGYGRINAFKAVQAALPPRGTLQFSSATYSVDETAPEATVSVSREAGSAGAVAVAWSSGSGSADSPADFTASTGTLTWEAGDPSPKTFTVTITNDTEDETDETILLTLSNPTGGAALGVPAQSILTILDDDVPQLAVEPLTMAVPEGGESSFSVRLDRQPAAPVTVHTARSSGDADLDVSGGETLRFTDADWSTRQTVTLSAALDDDAADGRAVFTVSSALAGVESVMVQATETDDDAQDLVVTGGPVTVPEGFTATFGLRLGARPQTEVVVTVSRISGDDDLTVSGADEFTYTPVNWNVDQTVTLAAADDPDELHGAAIFEVSAPGWITATVNVFESDNDGVAPPPGIIHRGPAGYGPGQTVEITNEIVYSGTLLSLLWTPKLPPGWGVVSVAAIDGGQVELDPSQTGILWVGTLPPSPIRMKYTAKAPNDAIGTAQIRGEVEYQFSGMVNPDTRYAAPDPLRLESEALLPVVTISVSTAVGSETGPTKAVATVRRSGAALEPLTVFYNQEGTASFADYTGPTGSVTMQAGERSADIDIIPVDDHLVEPPPNETLTLILIEGNGYLVGTPARAMFEIVDNDALELLVSAAAVTVREGQTADFTVNLSAQPANPITVRVERTSGDSDITVSEGSSLSFTPANWNVEQTVRLRAGEDEDGTNGQATFTVMANGMSDWTVTATEVDNDPLGPVSPGDLPDSLVAWWKLDEVSGGGGPVFRRDSVGSNHLSDNNTVVSGEDRVRGVVAQFDGPRAAPGEYLAINEADQTGLTFGSAGEALTVGGWIRADLVDPTDGILGMTAPDHRPSIQIQVTQAGSLEAGVGQGDLWATVARTDEGVIQPGRWHHVALAFEPLTEEVRTYVDGTLQGLALRPGGIRTLPGSVFVLGSNVGFRPSDFFSGSLSDWGFWRRALSEEELRALARKGGETPRVSAPTISPDGGLFDGPVEVILTCDTVGATLRYTIDGTNPTAASEAYAEPLTLRRSGLLKAAAFQDGSAPSLISSAGFALTSQSRTAVPTDFPAHLIARWKLDEASDGGSPVQRRDSVGTNHLIDINTVASAEETPRGVVARFDGPQGAPGEYLSLNEADQAGLGYGSADEALTVAGWVRAGLVDSTDGILGLTAPDHRPSVQIQITQAGSLEAGAGQGNLWATVARTDDGTVHAGQWHYIALVYEPQTAQVRAYVDGALQGLALRPGGIRTPSGSVFVLGSNVGFRPSDFFSGSLSDWAFWRRALSEGELRSLAGRQ